MAPSGGSRRAQRGVRGTGSSLTICARCCRRGARPPHLAPDRRAGAGRLLRAAPRTTSEAAAQDVPRRLVRRPPRRRREGHRPTPTPPRRCWSRPPRTCPDATLSAKLGDGHRRRTSRRPSAGPRPGTSPPPPTGPTTPRCDLREAGDGWQVVAEPTVVHPELGEGQHLVLARSLPERAPITDAAGRAAVHARPRWSTSASTRRRSPTCRRWPPRSSAATGIAADDIVADVAGRARGPVRPGHHPAPARLREDPRPGLRPARRGLPDRRPGCWRPSPRFAVGAARPGRRGHRRGHRGVAGRRRAALRRRRPARASPACSGPSRSSWPAPPASPSRW